MLPTAYVVRACITGSTPDSRAGTHLVRFSISVGMLFSLFPPIDSDCSRHSLVHWSGISSKRFPLKFNTSSGREPKSLGRENSSRRLFLASSVLSLVRRVMSSQMAVSPLLLMSKNSRLWKTPIDGGRDDSLL